MAAAIPVSASQPLEGWALLLARATWLALAAIQIASFLTLVPAYFTLADHPCPLGCVLTLQRAQSLTSAGISPHAYVPLLLAATVISAATATTMAILLFLRRSHDRMALIAAYFILILPTTLLINSGPTQVSGPLQTTAFALPLAADLTLVTLQTATLYGLLLIFPGGRFTPRWTWLLLAGFFAFTTIWVVWPNLQDGLAVGWIFFFGGAIANIAYRYRRISTPQEQQQTKWVVVGLVTFLLLNLAYWMPTLTPLATTAYAPLSYLAYQLLLPVMPITFFIAIQRYRLYDIDTIIRRTLIYASLTAILVAIYAAGILGAQAVLQAIGGRTFGDSPPVTVVTTLVIAALFLPLRRRIQTVIDRRFYRSKYDTVRILATFAAALRSDVDLEHLRGHLIGAVDESLRPAHVSLWLRTVEDRMSLNGTRKDGPSRSN